MNDVEGFYNLEPEKIFTAAESIGFSPTGELQQLNSFENRVFSIRLEDHHEFGGFSDQLVGKFYRPGRWSRESILDEHQFTRELLADGVTCVPPITIDGETLFEIEGIKFAFFAKTPGRLPQELTPDDLVMVGRTLARLHNVGARSFAENRWSIGSDYYGGWDTLDGLHEWIAPEVRNRYLDAAEDIVGRLEDQIDHFHFLRVHGDCHRGNLLHNEKSFFFIDFDDFVNGPAVQDFWMLLTWDEANIELEKEKLLRGYSELRIFNDDEWKLVDLLRGLRIIGYAGWIAARWDDPSFPKIFPQFESYSYWAEEAEALEKIAWK